MRKGERAGRSSLPDRRQLEPPLNLNNPKQGPTPSPLHDGGVRPLNLTINYSHSLPNLTVLATFCIFHFPFSRPAGTSPSFSEFYRHGRTSHCSHHRFVARHWRGYRETVCCRGHVRGRELSEGRGRCA